MTSHRPADDPATQVGLDRVCNAVVLPVLVVNILGALVVVGLLGHGPWWTILWLGMALLVGVLSVMTAYRIRYWTLTGRRRA